MTQTKKAKENEPAATSPSSPQTQSDQSQELKSSQKMQDLSSPNRYSSPFSLVSRFREEMDRLFEDFGLGTNLLSSNTGRGLTRSAFDWTPQIESFERDGKLIVQADLPGMTKDNINVDIEDDQIVIRGERHNERQENKAGLYHTERSYGSFYRTIPLPPGVDPDQADARFSNGVLEITMPMPEQKRSAKRLEISEGNSSIPVKDQNQTAKTGRKDSGN
jgi:HSP20 family protein